MENHEMRGKNIFFNLVEEENLLAWWISRSQIKNIISSVILLKLARSLKLSKELIRWEIKRSNYFFKSQK